MKIQERKRFVERAKGEYARARKRKEKSALIDTVVQFVGYKSRKQAISVLNYRANKSAHQSFSNMVESKERHSTCVIRRMDKPQTPYQRVLMHLKEGARKQRLKAEHEVLNPWKQREEI